MSVLQQARKSLRGVTLDVRRMSEKASSAKRGSVHHIELKRQLAESQEAWHGAGDEPGVQVWRIDDGQVKEWPQSEFGNFYRTHCYIILKTSDDPEKHDDFVKDIHMWLGGSTTEEQRAQVEALAEELNDYLESNSIEHREVEGHESLDFLDMFSRVNYLDSDDYELRRYNPRDDGSYQPRLFMVRKHHKTQCLMEVPCSVASLNHGDCYILDAGERMLIWHGDDTKFVQRNMVTTIAQNIASVRGGKSRARRFDSSSGDELAFWKLVAGAESDVASAVAGLAVFPAFSVPQIKEAVLYKLLMYTSVTDGRDHKKEMARAAGVKQDQLDSNFAFVVESGSESFIWIGKDATDVDYRKAWKAACGTRDLPMHMLREDHDFVQGSHARRTWERLLSGNAAAKAWTAGKKGVWRRA